MYTPNGHKYWLIFLVLFIFALLAVIAHAGDVIVSPKLLEAVAMIESSDNPGAYNKSEQAVGIYQIRQLAVSDLNNYYGTDYKLEDFYDPKLSKWAFIHYGVIWGARTAEEYCRIWNGGPEGIKKGGAKRYWEKIKKVMLEYETQKGD